MIPTVKLCSVSGCRSAAIAKGICDLHYRRLRRHGTVEMGRPGDWGKRSDHPLYKYWAQVRRNGTPLCEEWNQDFWQFVEEVGDRPSPTHTLYRPDKNSRMSATNCHWAESKGGPARDGAHRIARSNKAAYMRRYNEDRRAKDPLLQMRIGLKRTHGIELEDYENMMDTQGGVCAICARVDQTLSVGGHKTIRLAVDHHHGRGEIRGLLCGPCNHALGLLDDSPELLRRAIAYLANPPAAVLGIAHNGKFKARRRAREQSPFVENATSVA